MSSSTVRSAIQKAIASPASKKAQVTKAEARAVIQAATTEPRGAAKIGKEEAELIARLAGQSAFEGTPSKYSLTSAAKKEIEGFFATYRLPFGANADAMRAQIEKVCAAADLSSPLASAPSPRGLHKLVLSDKRASDGALREAYVDSANGTFYLKTVSGGRGNAGATSWFGPLSLQAAAGNRDADLAALQAKIAAATKDLLFTSESDYPFEFFVAPGAGKSKPTAADMLAALNKPADTAIEIRSESDFFDQRTTPQDWWGDYEKAQATKYQALRGALEQNLTDLQVFRVGTIQVGVYVVGRNQYGDLVGVSTTSIET